MGSDPASSACFPERPENQARKRLFAKLQNHAYAACVLTRRRCIFWQDALFGPLQAVMTRGSQICEAIFVHDC